jgi:hypothetical protein
MLSILFDTIFKTEYFQVKLTRKCCLPSQCCLEEKSHVSRAWQQLPLSAHLQEIECDKLPFYISNYQKNTPGPLKKNYGGERWTQSPLKGGRA